MNFFIFLHAFENTGLKKIKAITAKLLVETTGKMWKLVETYNKNIKNSGHYVHFLKFRLKFYKRTKNKKN